MTNQQAERYLEYVKWGIERSSSFNENFVVFNWHQNYLLDELNDIDDVDFFSIKTEPNWSDVFVNRSISIEPEYELPPVSRWDEWDDEQFI